MSATLRSCFVSPCSQRVTKMPDEPNTTQTSDCSDKMDFTGERYVPGIDDPVMQMEHLQRYLSLLNAVKGLDVLDIACGEGYGSNLISGSAGSVTGVDISQEAVDHANARYHRDNLRYVQGSAADLSAFEDASFDAVISFETIEHIDEPSQQAFLREIKRVVRPNGFLIMSTPDKKIYSDLHDYHNEYHVREFYKDEFVSFLKSAFTNVCLFNQYFEVTGIMEKDSPEGSGDGTVMRFGRTPGIEGKYLVAIASDRDVSSIDLSSVYMNPVIEYENRISRILQLQREVEERNKHIQYLDAHIVELDGIIDNYRKHSFFGRLFRRK